MMLGGEIDWSILPSWALYVTQDKDGAFMWEVEPLMSINGVFVSRGGRSAKYYPKQRVCLYQRAFPCSIHQCTSWVESATAPCGLMINGTYCTKFEVHCPFTAKAIILEE